MKSRYIIQRLDPRWNWCRTPSPSHRLAYAALHVLVLVLVVRCHTAMLAVVWSSPAFCLARVCSRYIYSSTAAVSVRGRVVFVDDNRSTETCTRSVACLAVSYCTCRYVSHVLSFVSVKPLSCQLVSCWVNHRAPVGDVVVQPRPTFIASKDEVLLSPGTCGLSHCPSSEPAVNSREQCQYR